MTVFRFQTFLVALCLLAGPALAQSANDRDNGGMFSTPANPYAQRSAPNSGSLPNNAPGADQTRNNADLRAPPALNSNTRQGTQDERALELYEIPRRRVDLAPPKPGEFQKFVEAATGRLLPVFGARFFADAADTYSPLGNVPVSADYTIGPGDEIILRTWGAIDVDYRSTVDRNGMLNLPKIGSFSVAGVKAADLQKNLRAQIGRLYTNFDLSVSLGQLRAVKVFVVGPAQRPGVYTLPSQSTLLSAVVAAGGPGANGSMRKISLRRDGRVISELDVYEFLVQGDKSKDMQLAAGDVVVFQPAGARVALNGALDTPAIYELKTPQEPLREVLRYAGGVPVLANPHRVQLERIDPLRPQAARFVEEFSLDANGLQKPLRDGDVLTLLAISPQFANAVTLKGHVAQPLRYPYTPGMRIHDLIPDPQALISPDFYRRKNLLVQVIEDDDYYRGRDRLYRDRNRDDPRDNGAHGGGYGDRGAYSGYGGYDDPGPYRDDGRRVRDSRDVGDALNVRNPRAANAARGLDASRNLNPRDAAQRGDSRSERGVDRDLMPLRKQPPAPLFDELNWDYAVIERLNPSDLSTEIIPFNLGKVVLQNDPANNLLLMPGDVVTIYGQKDIRVPVARQTRLVSLEGEVNSPGVYQLQAGETLKTLIARAGGFTPQAYVYGLEFSREETRERQRENLAAAIARLETLSAVQAARDAANRRDDTSAAAATTVSNAATQAQLTRLSRIQPNGRIALELDPDAATLDALPELPLENADRISVPPRPGFVTVAGAVVNSNAFVWKPGRSASDYLKLAGTDEAADPSNMFILRADGTVTHANERRGLFSRGNRIESQPMYPGDALIVPNQLDFETWGRAFVRNLKDFSQIFSGFGIGIAAINAIQR